MNFSVTNFVARYVVVMLTTGAVILPIVAVTDNPPEPSWTTKGPMTTPKPGWTTTGTVSEVIDGDTIEVTLTRTIRVRLDECWAPETHLDPRLPEARRAAEKQAGLRSRQRLVDKALGKECTVHVGTGHDLLAATTLGRVLARVWVDGVDLSESQVADGMATKTKRDELR